LESATVLKIEETAQDHDRHKNQGVGSIGKEEGDEGSGKKDQNDGARKL
jgi:hypothetical protein